jgi:lipoprotein-releasing system permease protein
MRAIGMGRWQIVRVFVLQGAAIGAMGTACGTGAGLLVIRFRNQVADLLGTVMGVEVFPKKLYHLTQIPALVKGDDLSVIVTLAFAVCIAASLLPALYAAMIPPAKALQDEG